MTDDQYKDMVISHDKHIDTLTGSIKSLASNVGKTNTKLDNVIDVITQQNVLIERVNNLDTNIAESFSRAWHRIDKLEGITEKDGCAAIKTLHKEEELFAEKLKTSDNDIKTIEADIKTINVSISEFVKGTTIKWAVGLLIFYAVTFGVYTVTIIHDNEAVVSSYIAKNEEQTMYAAEKLNDIITIMREDRNVRTSRVDR